MQNSTMVFEVFSTYSNYYQQSEAKTYTGDEVYFVHAPS